MSILTDSSSISDFCSFSISRGGKSDFSKNKFIDAKVSAQCQSSNYFKGVVLKSKKNGEILEIEINGLFKGKIDKQTNINLKSFKDNNQLNKAINTINKYLENNVIEINDKIEKLKKEKKNKELAAKKKAEEEKKQKELAAKRKLKKKRSKKN